MLEQKEQDQMLIWKRKKQRNKPRPSTGNDDGSRCAMA